MDAPQPRTEKAKMLAGELYFGDDPELVRERSQAQQILMQLNASSDLKGRTTLLTRLLGNLGAGSTIMPPLRCDYGCNIRIGARTFINYDCVLLDCNLIDIGDEVQIAPGVHIYTATHPLDPRTRRSGAEYALPVAIADGVWLGGGAIVCPGVAIGENSVVGAGSVVVKSIPANVLAAGNPCRVIRPL